MAALKLLALEIDAQPKFMEFRAYKGMEEVIICIEVGFCCSPIPEHCAPFPQSPKPRAPSTNTQPSKIKNPSCFQPGHDLDVLNPASGTIVGR